MQNRTNGKDPDETEPSPTRVRGRPFAPGQSGNPRGKQKGTRNLATRLIEALLEGEAEEIGRKTIELAKEGDSRALKACLDRLVPPPRDRFVAFSLPPLETAADLPKASAALLAAVAEGEVTPSEAAELAHLVETHIRAIEVSDLEHRLCELEERLDE
jgi:hypothetical protein